MSEAGGRMDFRLVRFNPRRAARGAPAAEVECSDGIHSGLLWMSLSDVLQNISGWGPQPGLLAARQAYREWKERP